MPRRKSRYHRGPGALRVFLYSVLTTTLSCPVAAASPGFNVTIDDASDADWSHTSPSTNSTVPLGSDDTIPRWETQACGTCLRPPDISQLHDRTYTELYLPAGNNFTYDISFKFNGTAIYVFFLLSNQAPTSCNFILDGDLTPYDGQTLDPYTYNTLAFSEPELTLEMHELTIRVTGKPDTANYLGFDFANFTRPGFPFPDKTFLNASTTPSSSSPSPTPSPAPENSHETMKAIVGGIVGGFLAILTLIIVVSFYRNRRLRELKKAADPVLGISSTAGVPPSRAPEEEHHLIPRSLSEAPRSNHSWLGTQTASRSTAFPAGHYDTRPHPFPLPTNHARSNAEANAREQVRQQRQREVNERLRDVKTRIRTLESSYSQDQQRLQSQTQQDAQEFGRGHAERHHEGGNPVIRLVPGGMPDPVTGRRGGGPWAQPNTTGDPMVNPNVLADMRDQIGRMQEQLHYLRAQQNSPYVQGLTDEPPPGYAQVINWDQIR